LGKSGRAVGCHGRGRNETRINSLCEFIFNGYAVVLKTTKH
jgi:hypothetical protein